MAVTVMALFGYRCRGRGRRGKKTFPYPRSAAHIDAAKGETQAAKLPMKRRLVFVVTEGWWLWLHWAGLLKAAWTAGYDVTVVTRAGEHQERIRELGFDFLNMDFDRGRLSPTVNLRTLRRLHTIYRRIRPDLVHHIALQPTVLGSAAATLAGIPAVVNTITGMGHVLASESLRFRLLKSLLLPTLGWVSRRSHTIVQNSDDAKVFVRQLGARAERVTVVRGVGVDLQRFTPSPEPEGPVRVAMVSRLLWTKGVGEFIEAASSVRKFRKNIIFTLVGVPDESNPAAVPYCQVEAWVAADLVEWWGFQNDIAEVWSRSHIAALPSWREGLPTSLLEAAACGRPIVTTDMPGCREAVRHGDNGLLVPIHDPRALSEAIITLADDPVRRTAMGAAGRSLVEKNFGSLRINEETLRVYERVLAE